MATEKKHPGTSSTAMKPVADAPTADYDVISPLSHDCVDYVIGDTVALTDAQAAPVLGQAVRSK